MGILIQGCRSYAIMMLLALLQTLSSTAGTLSSFQTDEEVKGATNHPPLSTLKIDIPIHATKKNNIFDERHCLEFPVPLGKYKEKCCRYHYAEYEKRWVTGSYYLVTLLDRMKKWECEQFLTECDSPTWNFTDYSSRIYDLYCRRSALEHRCYDDVYSLALQYGFTNELTSDISWKNLIETLDSSRIKSDDLTKPCVQVALYDRDDGGVGRFHEVIEPLVPFCGLQWEGYDYNTTMYRGVSPWTGMSGWCRVSVLTCAAVMAVLAVATIVANALILAVFGTTPSLRNSQTVYKISLAIADLMVGLVIWPNMVVLLYFIFYKPRKMGEIVHSPFGTIEKRRNLPYRREGTPFEDIFPAEYIETVGFFTSLSLMVSIYTLLIANIDRFWAVFRPLQYNEYKAKSQATVMCTLVWITSVVVCLLPVLKVVPGLKYQIMSSIMIIVAGNDALVFLLIVLAVPLVTTWMLNAIMFYVSSKHAAARRRISTVANYIDEFERRLAITLSIMVGTFTLSVLPAIGCTVVGFLSSTTVWETPSQLNITSSTVYTTSEYVSIIILTSNSLWNCFIYSLRTKGFRDAASSLMCSAIAQRLNTKRRDPPGIASGTRQDSISDLLS